MGKKHRDCRKSPKIASLTLSRAFCAVKKSLSRRLYQVRGFSSPGGEKLVLPQEIRGAKKRESAYYARKTVQHTYVFLRSRTRRISSAGWRVLESWKFPCQPMISSLSSLNFITIDYDRNLQIISFRHFTYKH